MDQRHIPLDVITETAAPVNQTVDALQLDAPTARIPAGFWRRVMAVLVDGAIYSILTMPLSVVLGIVVGFSGAMGGADPQSNATMVLLANTGSYLLSFAIVFLYYGWFYKRKGATPGKMLMRLRVSYFDTGTNLTYWRAFCRETFGKFVSAVLLCVGFLMVAFRRDKRALHDMLLNTQVTYEPK